MPSDWEDRKLMLRFLEKMGWLPDHHYLKSTIKEYQLESEFEQFKEMKI